jgi:cytochrome c oxidase assembly protein subunit 15
MATAAPPPVIDAHEIGHRQAFHRFAWTVLGWNILVVLWGAYVRASGSGAGCGSHWPLCNGEVVPQSPQIATVIEFTHRMMSGVAVALVVALYAAAVWRFPRQHVMRKISALGIFFIVTEALLGAGLVLFKYVAHDESMGRAIYLSAHLVNTLFLLAALTMSVFFSTPITPVLKRSWSPKLLAPLLVVLAVSVTGGVAALGDTLYPASSLTEGMRQEWSGAASVLLRLRVLHPFIAILGGAYVVLAGFVAARNAPVRRIALIAASLAIVQLCAGALNVLWLAPVWMQIVHLLIADLLWISLVALLLSSITTRFATPSALSDT